ncbi:MAG: hypothetical protein AB7G62_01445 [Magnetospirillum sp.]
MTDDPIFDPDTGELIKAGGAKLLPAPAAMSLDDARAMLVRAHGVAISADDPILMLVSLHQGFVADYEAMLRRHDDAIRDFLGATGEACAAAVEEVLASLKDKTVKASIDNAFALVTQQATAMEQLRAEMRRHRRAHFLLTVLTLIGAGLVVGVLTLFIR